MLDAIHIIVSPFATTTLMGKIKHPFHGEIIDNMHDFVRILNTVYALMK